MALCVHVDLVTLQFLPKDQFLYLYLVAPVGAWRYKFERNFTYFIYFIMFK